MNRKGGYGLTQKLRIAYLRKRALLTQEELADRIGVTRPCLSQYETGRRRIPVSLLPRIRDALGCTWDELFDERGEA